MKNTKKYKKIKGANKPKKSDAIFTFGNLDNQHGRILILVVLIIFVATFMLVGQMRVHDEANSEPSPVKIRQIKPLEKQLADLVHGYPIENMVPYISQQDPKVAAFLVAIAKKESAWGQHHPVLNGQDCYNYWGFRLKTEKMGSGGHTCFDSPKQAVETIASRIDQLVNQENIDTPNKMIVWKCGYGCQDKPKKPSEKKWISDVDMFYNDFNNYL